MTREEWEQLSREEEAWDRSIEGVINSLTYYGDDVETQMLIAETVGRLPTEVREYVFARCVFVSVGRANYGFVLPGYFTRTVRQRRRRQTWVIVLADNVPPEDAHSIVAHEIAHAWFRHDRFDRFESDPEGECEVEAVEQVRAWGFTGFGADVAYHQKGQK